MQKKAKLLIIFNFLFYMFIFLHKSYLYDYVPQVLFYMSLAFSTAVLEETIRNKIKKLGFYSFIDFLVRIGVLIIHFLTLIFKLNIVNINIITIILFLLNVVIEGLILNIAKEIKEENVEFIKQDDINKFIDDFKSKKLNVHTMGTDLKDEIDNIIKALETSGKSTIVIIILLILIFVSRYVYEHFVGFIFIPMLLIIPLLYVLYKLSNETISSNYSNNQNIEKKKLFTMIAFLIGYVILCSAEVVLYGKLGYMDITIRMIAILFFTPIFNTKYKLKRRLEYTYKKYKEYIS